MARIHHAVLVAAKAEFGLRVQQFDPGFAAHLTVRPAGCLQAGLALGEHVRVVQRHRHLVGHDLQRRGGDLVERLGLVTSDCHRADGSPARAQRERDLVAAAVLGSGSARDWMAIIPIILAAGLWGGRRRLCIGDAPADESFADPDMVPSCQRCLPGFACAGPQRGPLAGCIQEKEAHKAQIKALADQLGHLRQQLLLVENRRRGATHFCRHLQIGGSLRQLARAVRYVLLQVADQVAQLAGHRVECLCQHADLIRALHRHTQIHIALGDVGGGLGQVGQRTGNAAGDGQRGDHRDDQRDRRDASHAE